MEGDSLETRDSSEIRLKVESNLKQETSSKGSLMVFVESSGFPRNIPQKHETLRRPKKTHLTTIR
eukprot:51757-Pyramimonas_sp.AAC.1